MGGDAGPDSTMPLSCDDGVRNGDETHIDCGGSCDPCPDGAGCVRATDCQSMVCRAMYCLVPSCMDAIQNGDELGVDCGAGGTCPGCPGGTACTDGEQCLSHICESGTCTSTSCEDGLLNADETDVDCGGTVCPGCPADGVCTDDSDCASLICDAGACTMASCVDGVINEGESDYDCGGPRCPACGPGSMCTADSDCSSNICDAGTCTMAGCRDGVQNQDETDVDCGGSSCMPCTPGDMCMDAEDCDSSICDMGTCAMPACDDMVLNGGESDVDCGGMTICPRCPDYRACTDPADCTAGSCTMGFCGDTGCMPFPGTSTDTFGYFGCTIPLTPATLPCPDISSTGTSVTLSDDGQVTVPLGFTFDFYGTPQTDIIIEANGALAFASTALSFTNACLPRTTAPTQFIAAFWDDLYPPTGGTIEYETVGTAPARRFVTRWNIYHIGVSTGNTIDVTAVLEEDTGHVKLCYADTAFGSASYDYGASATVGINGTATDSLQFSCNTASLSDGLYIQYIHP